MGNLTGKYDENAEPSAGADFTPIPDGDYDLEIVEAETKPNNDGTGDGLNFRMSVIDGEYKGRLIFNWINLTHDNPQAQSIGQSEFAALRYAIAPGFDPGDTEDLKFKSFRAKIGTKPASTNRKTGKEYAAGNKVVKYYPAGESEVPSGKAAPVANDNKPAVAPAAKSRPWGKKAA